jgi:hypothetical protein
MKYSAKTLGNHLIRHGVHTTQIMIGTFFRKMVFV